MGTLSSSSASHLIRCRFILRPTLPYFHSSININPKQSLIIPLQPSSSFSTRNLDAYPPISTRRLFFSSTAILYEPANDVFAVQNEIGDFDEGRKSQQLGKSGVTDTVITTLIETLKANELPKILYCNSLLSGQSFF
ncbi:RNA-binding, CRM domain-containing, partial [Olea europaea subsp. europaea]